MRFLLAACALTVPTAVVAQTGPASAPTPAAAAIDPARLDAARQVLDVMMPPEKRATMFDAMLTPMLANIRQAVVSAPAVKAGLESDPRMGALLDRFLERQNARTVERLKAALPGMFEAMTRAYARRFTVRQLADIRTFFDTPSGRAYIEQGMTIMSDPDVLAWQRDLMQGAMGNLQSDIEELTTELKTEGGKP